MKFFKSFNEAINPHIITLDELKPILEAHQASNKPIYLTTYPGSKVVFLIKKYIEGLDRELQMFTVHSDFQLSNLQDFLKDKKMVSPNAVFIFDEVTNAQNDNIPTYIELSLKTGYTTKPNTHWTILISNSLFGKNTKHHEWYKSIMDWYEIVPPHERWRQSKELDDMNNATGVLDA